MESKVTSNGRITIPKAIRKHYELKPGDEIEFFLRPGRSAAFNPKHAPQTRKRKKNPKFPRRKSYLE
jgi:AbrB family looped-hinge helix DNA binding protein